VLSLSSIHVPANAQLRETPFSFKTLATVFGRKKHIVFLLCAWALGASEAGAAGTPGIVIGWGESRGGSVPAAETNDLAMDAGEIHSLAGRSDHPLSTQKGRAGENQIPIGPFRLTAILMMVVLGIVVLA
jgi:hypothetical protein